MSDDPGQAAGDPSQSSGGEPAPAGGPVRPTVAAPADGPLPAEANVQTVRPRPHAEASRRVAEIMRAAETAAEEIRRDAERRADARIAEAARAAQLRVAAAEEEAAELVAEAQQAAAERHAAAEADAAATREAASAEAAAALAQAAEQASETQRIADVYARETRDGADEQARRRIARSRQVADEVLEDGTELGHHVRQLSDSLRRNAELLLRDVTAAHRSMSERLGDAAPQAAPTPARGRRDDPPFGEVPEFVPRA